MSDRLKQKIEQAIKDGKTLMKPRWQFTAEHAIAFVTGMAFVLLIWYVGSLVTYVIRTNELRYLPSFGPVGWHRLFVSLPWVPIIIGGLLIMGTTLLTRNQTTLYRLPWGLTLIGTVFIALAGIAALNQLRFHDRIVRSGPPRFIQYYSPLPQAAKPIFGTVVENATDQFVIENIEGTFMVQLENAKLPPHLFTKGEGVVIIGEPTGHTIKAFGVKPIRKRLLTPPGFPASGVQYKQ